MNAPGKPADTTVIVGISGGVDSAVAALLLLEQGYHVQGLHMTNWDEADDYCSAAEDYQVARQVCADLDIPLHHVNFAKEYQDKVFTEFLAELKRGRTPNPDVACNRYIKFGDCLRYAERLGADFVATGHYARIGRTMAGDDQQRSFQLLKGRDAGKDQSYFLHSIRPDTLPRILFPLGELEKGEVRRIANERGLPNYARKDSTGICFIGERPFKAFLEQFVQAENGLIETPEGVVIGEHEGLPYYTLGQRQGLGIGGLREFSDEPWYVAAKDERRNVLVATQGRQHPLLWSQALLTEEPHWLAGHPPAAEFQGTVKTRYRQADVPCTVEITAGGTQVAFEEPVWAVTPGQYAVFYSGDVCLGGAIIRAPIQSPAG